MGGGERKLTGPNLKDGVALNQLKEGQKLLGHADGEAVLLVREGNSVYAVGASCTHYGADLNEGIVADGTVRCPWHHACFDYKTGEAKKAPALNPLPTWNTEVQNGTVFVREKKQPSDGKNSRASDQHFVIVGSGAAGHAASEMLRRKGFAGKITVVSEDNMLPYDRPNLSKDYLAGNAPEEWMPLRGSDFYREQKIEFKLNCKVKSLNAKSKSLQLADGGELKFDRCLLATGGSPVKPPIEGVSLPHVYFLRSMADCQRVISGLNSAKKIVVVGSGFIGLEAAAALRSRGLEVTVVAPGQLPLANVFGDEVGKLIKSVHESNGVSFKMGCSVTRIEKSYVKLSEGTQVSADLVLVATGISPNIGIAKEAGLKCDDGILVSDNLETSAKDIFAAGDVARYPGGGKLHRIEHWAVAQRQGQAAAMNMLGETQAYRDVPFFWSQQFDLGLSYVGAGKGWERTEVFGSLAEKNCAVAYYEGAKIIGVLTIGRDKTSLCIEQALEHGDQAKVLEYLKS